MNKLHFRDRWDASEPEGRRGGLLVAWNQNIEVKQIRKTDFCIELRVGSEDGGADIWIIFVYANPEMRIRVQQWDYLRARRSDWGRLWVMGGDFNDIKNMSE